MGKRGIEILGIIARIMGIRGRKLRIMVDHEIYEQVGIHLEWKNIVMIILLVESVDEDDRQRQNHVICT